MSTSDIIPRTSVRQTSTDARGRQRRIAGHIPAEQSVVRHHRPQHVEIDMRSVPSNLFTGAQRFVARLEPQQVERCRSLRIKMTLTIGAAADVVPGNYWFARVEIKSGTTHLAYIYPWGNQMQMVAKDELPTAAGKQRAIGANWGLSTENYANGSHDFYLEMTRGVLEGIRLASVQHDLQFTFTPDSSGILNTAGTGPTCDAMSFQIDDELATAQDRAIADGLHRTGNVAHYYLSPEKVEFTKQLSAGNLCRLETDAIVGRVSFLLCMIRESQTNVGNKNASPVYWGKGATINLTDGSGRNLVGSKSIPVEQLDFAYERWFGRTANFFEYKPAVLLSLCDNPKCALRGKQDGGGMRFSNERHFVEIKPGSDFASGQYEVTIYAFTMKSASLFGGQLSVTDV